MPAGGCFTHIGRLLIVLLSFFFVTPVLSAPAALQIDNELLLDLRLEGEKLGLDILGYQRGRDFLLSLDELTNGLGFPITVDGVQGTANGWYITEDRVFSLDLARGEVVSGGKRLRITEGDVVMFQGGLYVEVQTLQQWFPLRLSAVVRELYLDVEPTELLPIQQRMNRRGRTNSASSGYQVPQYPLQENPYQLFGPHITKVRLSNAMVRQNSDADAQYTTNYALLSRGDIAWMTSTLSLAGQTEEDLTGAYLKLERTAFDGPLNLNHVEIGDISSGGRGLLLRGGGVKRALDGRFADETVTIEGSQLPDWDVELYQNGQLILTQTTGQDGRYLFEDVPLQFGENRFEIKFFGPYGETESREAFHFLGPGMLAPGRISYDVTAVQKGRTVFGVNETNVGEDRDSGIYTTSLNLGLSENLTAGASVRSEETNGQRVDSSSAGFNLVTSSFSSSLRYNYSPISQDSLNTSLRTRLGDTSLTLGYIYYYDDPDLASSPIKWSSSLGVTSSIFSLPIKLRINRQEQEESTQSDAAFSTTIALPGSGRFSSGLSYDSVENRSNGSTTTTSQTTGQTSFHTVIRPWSFRLGASYRLEPVNEMLSYSANSSLRIKRDLTLNLDVRENPVSDITYYQGGVSWQLKQAVLSARVGYDSTERWSGFITLSTALVHQPGTLMPRLDSRASVGAGSVEARVTGGDAGAKGTPIEGVKTSGVQAFRRATTDENGEAYLSRMPAYRQVDIEIDESTLSDSDLRSKNPGVSVISRPGSYVVVDFPVVRTAELEGHIRIATGNTRTPVSRALVQLTTLDGTIVAQRRSAFDGFYLFDGIEPGVYQLSLEPSLAKRLINRPERVSVLNNSGVIRQLDFTLSTASAKTIGLGQFAVKQATPTVSAQATPKATLRATPKVTPKATPTVTVQRTASIPSPSGSSAIAIALPDIDAEPTPQIDRGNWYVQLGAYGSRDRARAFWQRASRDSQLFRGKSPRFESYQNMIRLLVGPGLSRAAAGRLCARLKVDRVDCFIRSVEL